MLFGDQIKVVPLSNRIESLKTNKQNKLSHTHTVQTIRSWKVLILLCGVCIYLFPFVELPEISPSEWLQANTRCSLVPHNPRVQPMIKEVVGNVCNFCNNVKLFHL